MYEITMSCASRRMRRRRRWKEGEETMHTEIYWRRIGSSGGICCERS